MKKYIFRVMMRLFKRWGYMHELTYNNCSGQRTIKAYTDEKIF